MRAREDCDMSDVMRQEAWRSLRLQNPIIATALAQPVNRRHYFSAVSKFFGVNLHAKTAPAK
jgi:hypothetical protein